MDFAVGPDGQGLQQIDMATIFEELMSIVRRYRLRLPPGLAVMGRTLLVGEGQGVEQLSVESLAHLRQVGGGVVRIEQKTGEAQFAGADAALVKGFPAAEVMDDYQICHDPWRRQRGSVILFNDEMYGELAMAGPSAQLSKTPARTKWLARPVGYHNRLVLKKFLGMSEEEINQLIIEA
jgi:hypothetical protein